METSKTVEKSLTLPSFWPKGRRFTRFFKKLGFLFTIVSLSNPLTLILIGLINRIFLRPLGLPIKSVFVCYAARKKYIEIYAFKWVYQLTKTRPVIYGIFLQGQGLALIAGISSQEKNFFESGFNESLHKNSDFIRKVLGADKVNYSGILPTTLSKKSLISESDIQERKDIVAEVVFLAEKEIRSKHDINPETPLILLGGKGNFGKAILSRFNDLGRVVEVVDIGERLPFALRDQKVILIDVSRKDVLMKYEEQLWKGLIVLNETYPEPCRNTLKKFDKKGVEVYHVAGVRAKAFPKFPHAYSDAIPCCAVNSSSNLIPEVRKLL